VPILAIAPRGSADTWTGCLNAGADDYIAVPYEKPVLRAHVRALMRRSSSQFSVLSSRSPNNESRITIPGCWLRVRDLSLNVITRIARRGEKTIALTSFPFRLLKHLMDRKGEICSRKEILLHVWGYEIKPGTNIVDKKTLRAMYNTVAKTIDRLREDIDPDIETQMIETVYGKGYRLRQSNPM
jgi:two-component system OmpR family response regulator